MSTIERRPSSANSRHVAGPVQDHGTPSPPFFANFDSPIRGIVLSDSEREELSIRAGLWWKSQIAQMQGSLSPEVLQELRGDPSLLRQLVSIALERRTANDRYSQAEGIDVLPINAFNHQVLNEMLDTIELLLSQSTVADAPP